MGGVQSLHIPSNSDNCDCGCCGGLSKEKEPENNDRWVQCAQLYSIRFTTETSIGLSLTFAATPVFRVNIWRFLIQLTNHTSNKRNPLAMSSLVPIGPCHFWLHEERFYILRVTKSWAWRSKQWFWAGQMLAVYSPSVPGAVPQKIDTMVPQTKWELLPIRTGVVVKSIKLLKTMRSG